MQRVGFVGLSQGGWKDRPCSNRIESVPWVEKAYEISPPVQHERTGR